jgi:cytochrome bd-type quinol oxidase subunit 2
MVSSFELSIAVLNFSEGVLKMKKMAVIQFRVLAVVSGIVTWLTFVTSRLAACHWEEIRGDGKARLPDVTIFSTNYGYMIPLGCCLIAMIFVVIALKRRNDSALLWWWFTLIAIIEVIGIAAISFFNMVPAIKIICRLV